MLGHKSLDDYVSHIVVQNIEMEVRGGDIDIDQSVCKNQMKQIHFGKGMPNIKLQFDFGDRTPGTIVTSFFSAMYVIIYCFLFLQKR